MNHCLLWSRSGRLLRALSLAFPLGMLALSAACKPVAGKKDDGQTKGADPLPPQPGFTLQDLKPVSGNLVRVVQGADGSGASVGVGVIFSVDSVIATGLKCDAGPYSLVFHKQKDEPPRLRSQLSGHITPVTSCLDAREILNTKLAEADTPKDVLNSLQSFFSDNPDFQLVKLDFAGGIPSEKKPKWAALPENQTGFDLGATADKFNAWNKLEGDFVTLVGFNRDVAVADGSVARRMWLPFRMKAQDPAASNPFVISLESNFRENDRSPLFKAESDWEQGPDKTLFPPIAVANGKIFPNVRAFTELQIVSPEALCFVFGWTSNPTAPVLRRHEAQCLSAAPIYALYR